jgi:glutamate racemase
MQVPAPALESCIGVFDSGVGGLIPRLLGPGVILIDSAAAVAERVASAWTQAQTEPARVPQPHIQGTGSSQTTQRLPHHCPGFETAEVEALTL